MKKVIGLVLGLLPISVFAECVPVPDCASIGYTETSCNGDSLKCPFDTSKLKCFPCDSSFRYNCNGENIKNSIGTACNNKYTTCECSNGAVFTNGECICDTSCNTIGNIYYSDGSCSSCNLTDKTPVGIVAYKNENKHLIISLDVVNMTWAQDQTDAEGNVVTEARVDIPTLSNIKSTETASADYNGFENTQTIVAYYGENATGVAAVYCYNYAPTGLESSKGQWYLPAAGELLDIIKSNKLSINPTFAMFNKPLWNHYGFAATSSEVDYQWHWRVNFGGDCELLYFYSAGKRDKDRIHCVFNIG